VCTSFVTNIPVPTDRAALSAPSSTFKLCGLAAWSNKAIIVTDLPYQVNKAALLEQITDKKLEGIADLRYESDRHVIRLFIELKPASSPQAVLNNLYQKTKLQPTFSGNIVALWKSNNNNNNVNTGTLTTVATQ
jgi:DNA gyrase/topoisomerase IV subunit A